RSLCARGGGAQDAGQRVDLGQARPSRRDGGGDLDDLGEEHVPIVPRGTDKTLAEEGSSWSAGGSKLLPQSGRLPRVRLRPAAGADPAPGLRTRPGGRESRR